MKVTVLHPGAMGVAVASSIVRAGHVVHYVPDGRSEATRNRAQQAGLRPLPFREAVSTADVVLSVCPPHAAEWVAESVVAEGYTGVYADANAISPERMLRIAALLQGAGATVIDGGIVGGPPKERHQTYLYLSGPEAGRVLPCFSEGLIEAEVVSDRVGDASALKMCYAAYTKGSTAMLLAITAAAENLGVRDALFAQWRREGSGLDEAAERRARFVTRKAWRWIDEMEEIAKTFASADQPDGFHRAAADVYRRLEHLRPEGEDLPDFYDVLRALQGDGGSHNVS